jgi:NitT/TauT family transport system substrate-binding protein
MAIVPTRRRLLAALSLAAAGCVRMPPALGAEERLETMTVRLPRIPGVCIAPQDVVGPLLRAEGFTDIRYVDQQASATEPVAHGEVDFDQNYASNFIKGIAAGQPITLLSGVHVGCFELFVQNSIRTIADLKGKSVGIQALGANPHVLVTLMAAEVGLDPQRDIHWMTDPEVKPIDRFIEGKIDAFIGFAPEPQELRARRIGHVLVNTAVDRPWSQYFCCMLGGNRDFVRNNPVATKRVLRAILKSADLCAAQPALVAREIVDRGFTPRYDYALEALRELPYDRWRDYDPEDTVRFYALRLHEVGLIESTPQEIIARSADWRFLDELKSELKA